jgi:hypothetical protein
LIVYGDHPIEIEPADFVAGLKRRFAGAPANIDEARVRLVLAGQLQQAVEDAGLDWAPQSRCLTDLASDVFVGTMLRTSGQGQQANAIARQLDLLTRSIPSHSPPLQVRTPEGFAWYALYPDAYAQAADRWARAARTPDRVLVIGVRSIGTTLAGVVAAVLRVRGLWVRAFTVRPRGHPFQRSTTLPADLPHADCAIVVDEGPGLSGSSMASVAEALIGRGLSRHAVTLFPGHGHGPGPEASEAVRRCWANAPQMTVGWGELSLDGHAAPIAVEGIAQSALQEPLEPLQDVGAGRWRTLLSEPFGDAHAIAPFLEQPKLLARGCSKAGLLVKFAGFALFSVSQAGCLIASAEAHASRLEELARAGWTVPPLANSQGWVGTAWVDGRQVRALDADAECLLRLGTYIRAVAGPPAGKQGEKAAARVRNILVSNTRELLGEAAADRAERASDALASAIIGRDVPTYGDGRMAPHEWLWSGADLLKLDAAGHQNDHLAVGAQPIWWDIAGVSMEWALSEAARDEVARVAGVQGAAAEATYFRAAYAALRAGIARLGIDRAAHDPGDRQAFQRALQHYGCCLDSELLRLETHCAPRARRPG